MPVRNSYATSKPRPASFGAALDAAPASVFSVLRVLWASPGFSGRTDLFDFFTFVCFIVTRNQLSKRRKPSNPVLAALVPSSALHFAIPSNFSAKRTTTGQQHRNERQPTCNRAWSECVARRHTAKNTRTSERGRPRRRFEKSLREKPLGDAQKEALREGTSKTRWEAFRESKPRRANRKGAPYKAPFARSASVTPSTYSSITLSSPAQKRTVVHSSLRGHP